VAEAARLHQTRLGREDDSGIVSPEVHAWNHPMSRAKKIIAVASGGGHWMELLRLRPAFQGHEVVFVTVSPIYRSDVGTARFYVVNDATRWDKLALLKLMFRIARVLVRERPDVVISTGAAPGCFAIVFGKLLRARTIWLDSIANVERLTLSGRLAGRFADLWLTQWPHLAKPGGPRYEGSVL